MKRPFTLIVLSLLLLAGCHREEIYPVEMRVQLESVTGSRARFTVVPESLYAYYSYVLVSEDEVNYNAPASAICQKAIQNMKDDFAYFQDGNFLDIFFYRGSRQFSLKSLRADTDFKFIVFQINAKTHELIGEPVVNTFHTKPVPERNLHFRVEFAGDLMTVTPSDVDLTYFWQYEESDLITDNYGTVADYLYATAGMYQEYGFLEYHYYSGASAWDFSVEDNMEDGTRYTLAVCGCEEGEFTTAPTIVEFVYHPGNIEVLGMTEGKDR